MTKLTEEQLKMLRSPLPKEAISQHPTKPFLSTIKAIYVVERLNQVFGIGNWNLKSEIIDNATSMIVVKSILTIPEYNIELESYGGNNNGGENSKNFDLGDAYKGATTDALTKICSYLEIGIDVFKGNGNKASYNEGKKPVNYIGLLKTKLKGAKDLDEALEILETKTGVGIPIDNKTKLEDLINNDTAKELLDFWQD